MFSLLTCNLYPIVNNLTRKRRTSTRGLKGKKVLSVMYGTQRGGGLLVSVIMNTIGQLCMCIPLPALVDSLRYMCIAERPAVG